MIDAGNLPRWRGEPGFFEIWFLVVFVPEQGRAYWLRYTLFSPAGRAPLPGARAILWAAAFDARADVPAVAVKRIHPISSYRSRKDGLFGIHIDESELSTGVCRGSVVSPERRVTWDLRFAPSPAHGRSPWLFSPRLPLPTRVFHAHEGLSVFGTITVDGRETALSGAPGLQKHLWGTRRVEELFWVYCPRFGEDPAARIEATSVRVSQKLPFGFASPAVSPVWLETSAGPFDLFSPLQLIQNEVRFSRPGELSVRASTNARMIELRAYCDPRSLVGYVYRDPRGRDLYVAQSDIASCEVEAFERSRPRAAFRRTTRLSASHAAAVEFHLPEPLDHVRYIPWDAVGLPSR